MPTTGRGILYPGSTDHNRLWEHLQSLATTADTAIGVAVDSVSAKMFGSVTQSVPSGATTLLALNTTEHDATSPLADLTNDRFVIVAAGRYHVTASVGWAFNATGYRALSIAINSVVVRRVTQDAAISAGVSTEQCISGQWLLAPGDTVDMRGLQTSGAALNTILVGTDQSALSIHKV
jgi:hypothetical protein